MDIYMYVYVGRSTVLIFLFRQFLDFWKALTELQALRILWNTKQIIGIFFFFFFFFFFLSLFLIWILRAYVLRIF